MKIQKIYSCSIFLVIFGANAQDRPSSPEGYLARAAGTYLGAHEYIFRLKESECGFAVVKIPKSYEQTINDEIAPAFQPRFRIEIKDILMAQKSIVIQSSGDYINSLVTSALKESGQEKKIVCGIIFGSLAGAAGQSRQNWISAVNKYGIRREQ